MPYAYQIQKILESNHHDPFHVLGYHEFPDCKRASIRAFYPNAASIDVVFLENNETYKMEKIRNEGFFHLNLLSYNRSRYVFRITNFQGNSWHQEDPYCHLPLISEFDLHLFSEGNHHKLYEFLGAHPTESNGIKGVHYAVWAPGAIRVSLTGNFNDWDGRRNMMRNRGTSGIWEIFIPGHQAGEIYKFEIKTQSGAILEKTDPIGFQFEMRPKTASIVADLNNYKWNDNEWMKNRYQKNGLDSPISIYEVHLGSWMKIIEENNRWYTYKEFADKLVSYVKWLGFTHIELLPITEYPFDGSWGYQSTGNYAPTSRYGDLNDFKLFVDSCHQAEIGVILDWVPAHFPKDSFSLAKFDGTALYEHEDPRRGEHQDWGTLIYNYGRKEVTNYLISSALMWYDIYHIDGIRVDAVASMLYLDYSREEGEWLPNEYGGRENIEAIQFLKKMNSILYQYYPDTLTIAEESTAFAGVSKPIYDGGLGFGFKWNMGWMHDFLGYMEKETIHRKFHHNELTFSMLYSFHENFILPLSHDEVVHGKNSLLHKMPGDEWQQFANLRLLFSFMYAHPGKKLIFMGAEIAQRDEWKYFESLDWHLNDFAPHKGVQLFMKDLNETYKKENALYEVDFNHTGFEWIDCSDYEGSVVSFLRWSKEYKNFVIAVFNFTPVVRHDYRLGVPFKGKYVEILNSDAEIYGGGNIGNCGEKWTNDESCMNRPYSIDISLPPLSALYLKLS